MTTLITSNLNSVSANSAATETFILSQVFTLSDRQIDIQEIGSTESFRSNENALVRLSNIKYVVYSFSINKSTGYVRLYKEAFQKDLNTAEVTKINLSEVCKDNNENCIEMKLPENLFARLENVSTDDKVSIEIKKRELNFLFKNSSLNVDNVIFAICNQFRTHTKFVEISKVINYRLFNSKERALTAIKSGETVYQYDQSEYARVMSLRAN